MAGWEGQSCPWFRRSFLLNNVLSLKAFSQVEGVLKMDLGNGAWSDQTWLVLPTLKTSTVYGSFALLQRIGFESPSEWTMGTPTHQ